MSTPQTWETIVALGAAIPDEEWDKLPRDLAANLDRYLYGGMVDMSPDAIAARRHCGCGKGIKPGNGDAPSNADLRCCIACVQKWKDRER